MLFGPIFVREAQTAPRPLRHYLMRACYSALLLVLMWTAWQTIVGFQHLQSAGDLARFGVVLFQLLASIQLSLALFFAPVLAANSICSEKDRRTFALLLMTDLSSYEIVVGKLLASMLQMVVLLVAGLPVFALCLLLGGVSGSQLLRVFLVTVAAALACGSLGILMGCWRERTFQSLALAVLVLVLYLLLVEAFHAWLGQDLLLGWTADQWRAGLNPFFTILGIIDPPLPSDQPGWLALSAEWMFVSIMLAATAILTVISIVMLRVWNPGYDRHVEVRVPEDEVEERAKSGVGEPKPSRQVWTNPVLWREVCTRGYGRRPLVIKLAYLLAFCLVTGAFVASAQGQFDVSRVDIAKAFVPLVLTSLILVNLQAVLSVTTERDGRSLDLLLVSDITPKEFIYGKLLGVFYNVKEMILLPVIFTIYLLVADLMTAEVWLYVVLGMAVLFLFSNSLGLHVALTYERTRVAVLNSLGVVVFLFIGMLVCIFLILVSGRFEWQAASFILFICAGAVAMYASLAYRNPSTALALASFLCPAITWWAIAHFLRGGDPLGSFLTVAFAYGFAVAAMLVPAVSEFDVVLGRTVAPEQ